MEVLKWILVICIILGLYHSIKKYAEKNSKDLFFYRIFCRINCVFFNGYYIKIIKEE